MDTDFLLIQKMRQGEENAFDLFVRKHYEEILKYCHFHCPDLSYAEDLTQETFLHFFERLSDYHYIGKTRNYLYTIAGNLCKDYYKKKKECFLEEQGRMLGYRDFLRVQLRLVRKRWWCLQAMLLFILWLLLPSLKYPPSIQRIMGACAPLFVILVIPELWKSQTFQFMEIEAVSYYSLRQIYASRMLLFGIVDIVLVSVFCSLSASLGDMAISLLLVHFLFPMTVTACICFGVLCSRYPFSESAAIALCLLWSLAWILLILNENIYTLITPPLWLALLGTALGFLLYAVCQTLHTCNSFLEGKHCFSRRETAGGD